MTPSDSHPGGPAGEPAGVDFDTTRRFVRLTRERPDGFVEFDFAVGEPELFVEMVLTRPAYEEFRRRNEAVELPPLPPEAHHLDHHDDLDWRLTDVPHFDH